jgi:DNA-binding transcriptional ArsR family regulator
MNDQYFFENIDQIQATAEPTRWKILSLLVAKPMTGAQLARVLGIPRPLAHYHLKILFNVGLVELEEERISGSVVEKYYRARARQYLANHLVDQYRSDGDAGQTSIQAGEAIRSMIQAMTEVARSDFAHPNVLPELARIGFNYQDEALLTQKQVNGLIADLRALGERYLQLGKENQTNGEGAETALHFVRYTFFITPVEKLDADLSIDKPELPDLD